MSHQEFLKALDQLSLFDLSQINVGITHELDNPLKIARVKANLHIGMKVQYFSNRNNGMVSGEILELNPKNALIRRSDGQSFSNWNVPYHFIYVNAAPLQKDTLRKHLTKATTSMNMSVGFQHQGLLYFGTVKRLNPTRATVAIDQKNYRVPYNMLFEVIEGESFVNANQAAIINLPAE